MRKGFLFFLGLLICCSHLYANLPEHDRFNLHLSKIKKGSACERYINTRLDLSYRYDFEQNIGVAWLHQLDETPIYTVLHPLGLSSMYAFMSDMKPVRVKLNQGYAYIYRVVFHLYKDGVKAAFVMFGQHGECILTSSQIRT